MRRQVDAGRPAQDEQEQQPANAQATRAHRHPPRPAAHVLDVAAIPSGPSHGQSLRPAVLQVERQSANAGQPRCQTPVDAALRPAWRQTGV